MGTLLVLVVSLVLIVACTNIANLMLGRGAAGQSEWGLRLALGASRGLLVVERCVESGMLACAGGLGGLIVARVLIHAAAVDLPLGNGGVVTVRPSLDAATLVLAGVALIGSLLVFGVIPAWQLTRVSLTERLSGQATGASGVRWKGRRRLIVVQVAISASLMFLAATSTRALTTWTRHDPGFDLQQLAVGAVNLRPMHWDEGHRRQAIRSIDAAARAHAGFASIALTAGLPLGQSARLLQFDQVSSADSASGSTTPPAVAAVLAATPAIFRTLGVPLLQGRPFGEGDTSTTPPVIVISERVARQVFGTTGAVGRQMTFAGASSAGAAPTTVTVVGVARDTDVGQVFDRSLGTVYMPLSQRDVSRVFLVGRTDGDPAPAVRAFRTIVRQADPDLAVEVAATGEMLMAPSSVILRVGAALAGLLSLFAAALAMVGLYGVLSHVVGCRTREIGVRLALGADGGRVCRTIIVEGLAPVVWGIGLGGLLAEGTLLIARATMQRDLSAIGPVAAAVVPVTLIVTGLLACYLPARRASRVDPNVALRDL